MGRIKIRVNFWHTSCLPPWYSIKSNQLSTKDNQSMSNPWIIGGNEIQGYTISRLARPNENVSAREWIMHRWRHNEVKVFKNEDSAQKYADKLNNT